jgi:hypothetical protein
MLCKYFLLLNNLPFHFCSFWKAKFLILMKCSINFYPTMDHAFCFLLEFYSAVWGFELRASHLLGMHSTTWIMPPVLFCFVIFRIESLVFAQADLDSVPSISTSHITGKRGTYHHTQLISWDGASQTFCSNVSLKLQSSQSPPHEKMGL